MVRVAYKDEEREAEYYDIKVIENVAYCLL